MSVSTLRLYLLMVGLLCSVLVETPTRAEPVPEVRRIAYVEAGNFWLYDKTWQAFQAALKSYPHVAYDYPADARVSPGWGANNIAKLQRLAAAMMQRDDIDLVVGMGTAAVKALLAGNTGKIPILGMGMADPVAAGVVRNAKDSGVDNFTCRLIADRWSSMYRVFYDVVRFQKLGVLYQDTAEGRIYAALDDAEAVAHELGFSLVKYGRLSSKEETDECLKGLEDLRQQGMDAFFIGPLNCFDWQSHPVAPLMDRLTEWKIPTFARDGSDFVKAGALMGFSTWDFEATGAFLARQAHAIFQGQSPRSLSMKDQVEPLIAVNLETARQIDFIFPLEVLVVADELHSQIVRPNALAH